MASFEYNNVDNITISLTDKENSIFNIMKATLNDLNRTTIVRVAGGWVRDKILGLSSDDIDVALDDCNGVDFAKWINDYMSKTGYETHTIGIIQANPDQSKHLETANVRIIDCPVDCVNLRAEEYSDTSRIPTIRFGSPEEDAYRRDFTINALFYNIMTNKIEDFTSKGIIDLKEGIIRTPLNAQITLSDDPLRVLRAIRFSSRYGYQIEDSLRDAARNTVIHKALQEKISRERILKELMGMLDPLKCHINNGPVQALSSIYKLGLFDKVFSLPIARNYIRIKGRFTPPTTVVKTKKSKKNADDRDINKLKNDFSPPFEEAEEIKDVVNKHPDYSIKLIAWINIIVSMLYYSSQNEEIENNNTEIMPLFKKIACELGFIKETEIKSQTIKGQYNESLQLCDATKRDIDSNYNQTFNISSTIISQNAPNLMLTHGKDLVSLMYVTACLWSLDVLEMYDEKRNAMKSLIQTIMKEVLKIQTDFSKRVESIILCVTDIMHFHARGFKKDELGISFRCCRNDWKIAFVIALANTLVLNDTASSSSSSSSSSLSFLGLSDRFDENFNDFNIKSSHLQIITEYSKMLHAMSTMDVESLLNLQPLFDGNSLQSSLPVKRGPQIGKLLEEQLKWQMRNPNGSKEDCFKFLQNCLLSS